MHRFLRLYGNTLLKLRSLRSSPPRPASRFNRLRFEQLETRAMLTELPIVTLEQFGGWTAEGAEGGFPFQFSRNVADDELTVYYEVLSESTASGSDYSGVPGPGQFGTVTFLAGHYQTDVWLYGTVDLLVEHPESVIAKIVGFAGENGGPVPYVISSEFFQDSIHISDSSLPYVDEMFVEWQKPTESWEIALDSEVLWQEDTNRWTAVVSFDPVLVVSNAWYKQPVGYPEAEWIEFAGGEGLSAIGDPGLGEWLVKPKIFLAPGAFGERSAFLAVAEEKAVHTIMEVRWDAPGEPEVTGYYPDGNVNGGGDMILAERLQYTDFPSSQTTIGVKVTIAPPVFPGWQVKVRLKAFDPDHYSTNPQFDTTAGPDDNALAGGATAIGGSLVSNEIVLTTGQDSGSTTFTITGRQPGNNFIIAAGGRREVVDAYLFSDDSVTLLSPYDGSLLEGRFQTNMLTVWRTLNIEEDSMGEPDNPFPAEFSDPGVGSDDVYPGDLGTGDLFSEGGTGSFVQPSLELLGSEFARANVRLRVMTLEDDFNDNATFIHNLANPLHGNTVRDIANYDDFWVVQVFASYEAAPDNDYDSPLGDPPESPILGNTSDQHDQAPTNVYLETIRDVAQNFPDAVDAERLRQRTVLHEVMHRFGHAAHDVGVMVPVIAVTGTDAQVELSGGLLRDIIQTIIP